MSERCDSAWDSWRRIAVASRISDVMRSERSVVCSMYLARSALSSKVPSRGMAGWEGGEAQAVPGQSRAASGEGSESDMESRKRTIHLLTLMMESTADPTCVLNFWRSELDVRAEFIYPSNSCTSS